MLKRLFPLAALLLAVDSTAASAPPASSCKPQYPNESRQRDEEGVSLLGFRINPDGSVGRTIVLNSSGFDALDQAALSAVSRCVFKPVTGAQGSAWIPVAYNWFMVEDPRSGRTARKLRRAADHGNPGARYHLSLILTAFAASDADRLQALATLRRAAEEGHAHAQYDLGRHYEKGMTVEADLSEALRWYEKAAAQGDEFAIERLKTGLLGF